MHDVHLRRLHLDAPTLGPPIDALRMPAARELRARQLVEGICASYREMMGQSDTTNGTIGPAVATYPSDRTEPVDVAPTTDRDVSVLERLALGDATVAEELQSVELAFARALRRSIEDRTAATVSFEALRDVGAHAARVRRRLLFTLRAMQNIESR